ncbi:hypothetical protein BDZ94DRAFT_1327025 [Collybia nuda]|uniref:SAP domain-containing protein n=1 Tax=Collybia nuda TaxID=64659 RepID=A0A9P6CBT4_9AGAR|nr:hypothetical protein BDZ94DRAFT_1327025 [Collybia nuda]
MARGACLLEWLQRREAREAEREEQRQQIGPETQFIGGLSSKSKPNLQDIAQALNLDTNGQKKDIMGHIIACFNADPMSREDPRFEGLFNRTRQRPAQTDGKGPNTLPSDSAGPLSSTLNLPPLLLASNVVNTYPLPYPLSQHGPFPFNPYPCTFLSLQCTYNHYQHNITPALLILLLYIFNAQLIHILILVHVL